MNGWKRLWICTLAILLSSALLFLVLTSLGFTCLGTFASPSQQDSEAGPVRHYSNPADRICL